MKLLVVVDTLNGSRIAWSIAITFTAPDPIPSRPESTPASAHEPEADRDVVYRVATQAAIDRIRAVEAQARRERVGYVVDRRDLRVA